MAQAVAALTRPGAPAARDVLRLLKPITWFPPMWAFLCGAVSSGASLGGSWALVIVGMALCGPFVCGASQAANDWYDRHVDALNEPDRPIPSGRIPGAWGFWIAVIGSAASLALAAAMGRLVLLGTIAALICGWAYSAPPLRLKRSGWAGPGANGLAYESLAWFTGAAALLGAVPSAPNIAVLLLYGLGALGIMTLNDFKAVDGDRAMGIRSLPATMGVLKAAVVACAIMILPQLVVVGVLCSGGHYASSALVTAAIAAQVACMPKLLRDPKAFAPWYNMTGVSLSVLGMMAAALGLGGWI